MQPSGERNLTSLGWFFGAMVLLVLVRVGLSFVRLPTEFAIPASVFITALFIGLPVVALYRAAAARWTPGLAVGFLVGGLVLQFGLLALVRGPLKGTGLPEGIAAAFSQMGLGVWCVGLGALLATLLKEKNLILPVAIFLALFDIFLVLTPIGPVQQFMQKAPQVLETIAYQVPSIQTTAEPQMPRGAPVAPFAFVGPADFLFMGMFFIAVFRFAMRTQATLKWLLVALAIYLVIAVFVDVPVPLLVPIGIAVMLVNLPEFKLNKEEWASTALIAALGVGLIVWGATRPRPPAKQAAPSPTATAPALPESGGSPAPALPSPRPSGSPVAPAGTPGPR